MKLKKMHYQIVAIILTLAAGYLWASRLAADATRQELTKIDRSLTEQTAILEKRVGQKNNPFELVNMGRKLLKAGSPQFAIVPLLRATKLKSGYRDAWYLLGYSYLKLANQTTDPLRVKEKQEHLGKAEASLRRAFLIDPNHEPTKALLEQLD